MAWCECNRNCFRLFCLIFFSRVKKGQHGITVSWYYRPEQVGEISCSLS